MNTHYRILWNALTATWVAVSEVAKGRGKGRAGVRSGSSGYAMAAGWLRLRLSPVALGLATLGWAHAAPPVVAPNQLPTGGVVVAGSASLSPVSANTLNITQSSQRAAIDWGTFNVGSAAQVNFLQPSASSVTLNRVLDSNPSQILGRMTATGQVFLSNPNGVLFAPGASVDVGGLVATTHGIGNADFMAGNLAFTRNGATGSVFNEGTLTSVPGGYIALLAPVVRNSGVIVAPGGTVALAAGEAFTLQLEGNRALTRIEVAPATIAAWVENGNAVRAPGGQILLSAQALNQAQGGVIRNTGTLEATGLTSQGGRIVLLASDRIDHSGSINVDATLHSAGSGGTVTLLASLANADSLTTVGGSITARAGDAGGNGGQVETSASHVKIAASARVSTAAPLGHAGTWLIDPADFTIAPTASADMSGATLTTALAGGSVVIQSSQGSNASGNGDILVNDAVSCSANTLTLTAARNIEVNAVMTATGNASVALNPATANGSAPADSTGKLLMGIQGDAFTGKINFSGTGTVSIGGVAYTVINSLGTATDATGGVASLQGLAASANLSGHYVLGSDLDALATATWNSGAGFTPIGTAATGVCAAGCFTGVLDGFGHTVSNLSITPAASQNDVGLIGGAGSGATLRNLGLTNAVVNAGSGAGVGTLAGSFNATGTTGYINNAFATGTVSGGSNLGGLVGSTSVPIYNSHAGVDVTSASNAEINVGGLVGYQSAQGIVNSYATGDVASGGYVGGLVGYLEDGTSVAQSHATGTVTTTGDGVGGLIGGAAGLTAGVTVHASYATGASNGGNYVGGLIGAAQKTTIDQGSFAQGAVSGSADSVGGLVGYSLGNTIDFTYATGTVTGGNQVGGLVGEAHGFAGVSTINLSVATGSVTGSGSNVGGLVGLNYAEETDATINRSYANGAVAGGSNVGGLVGTNQGNSAGTGVIASISNSFATGSVIASGSKAGGLVGLNLGGNGSIVGNGGAALVSNSYASGTVTGTTAGGLIGANSAGTPGAGGAGGASTLSQSLYDSTVNSALNGVAGTPDVAGSVWGMTTVQLKDATNLGATPNAANGNVAPLWDFTTTWNTASGVNNGYPNLAGFTPSIVGMTFVNYNLTSLSGPHTYQGTAHALSDLWSPGSLFGLSYSAWVAGTDYRFSYGGSQSTGFSNAGTYSGITVQVLKPGFSVDGNGNTSGSLTISKAATTVTGNSSTVTYNGVSQSLNGFTATGLVNGELASVLTGVSASGSGTNAGTYNVVPAGTDSNYTLTFVNGNLVIGKAAATVTGNSSTVTYNGLSQSVNGFTATGLVNGELASVLTGVSAAASGTNAGTYSVVPTGTDSNYTLTVVNGNLVIGKAPATVTGNSAAVTYNGVSQSVSGFTATGLVNGELASVLTGVSASGSGTNAGTYSVVPTGTDTNYTLTVVNGNLVIGKAPATVTGNSAAVTYNGVSQSVSGFTATGLVNGELASVLPGVSAAASGTNAGTYSVVPTGTDNNYTLSFVNGNLVIGKAVATVTGNSAAVTYNGVSQSVNGFTASGLVHGELASVLTGVSATGSGTNAGTYSVVPTGTDTNYTLTVVNGNLVIGKVAATVTGNSAAVTYNGVSQSVSGFTATGLVNGELASVLTGVSAAASGTNAGNYSVVPTGTDSNYTLSFVNGNLVIGKAAATVTGNSAAVTYNGVSQSVNGFTATGLVNGELASVLTGVSATGSGINAGTYSVVPTGTDTNYTLNVVNGNLVIGKAAATVTGNSAAVTYNGVSQSVNGFTATGLVHGELASVLTGVSATASGTNAGTYGVVPTGTDSNYTLSFVNGFLVITPISAAYVPPPPQPIAQPLPFASQPIGQQFNSIGTSVAMGQQEVIVTRLRTGTRLQEGLLNVSVPDRLAATSGFRFALPEAMAGADNVSLAMANGEVVPNWISLDAPNRAIVANKVPAGGLPLELVISVGGVKTSIRISATAAPL